MKTDTAFGVNEYDNRGSTAGFFLRHRLLETVADGSGSSRLRHITDYFDSPMECLSAMRTTFIPDRLREVSGLHDETDLDVLLESAGYSVSLAAESLIEMVDECLSASSCTPDELRRIKTAYNRVSVFGPPQRHLISDWGHSREGRGPADSVRNRLRLHRRPFGTRSSEPRAV